MIGETMICPKCGHIANHDIYFGAIVCRQCGWMHYDKPTNADRIRSMSDEELAAERVEKMKQISPYNDCYPIMYFCSDGYGTEDYDEAVAHELNWLRQPAEE